jgi:23S rRNA pseudouridine1911/1915/1917 synthase
MSRRSKAQGVDTGGQGESRKFQVHAEEDGMRLDRLLAKRLSEHSRSYLQELCEAGKVMVGESAGQTSQKMSAGEEIQVELLARHELREPNGGYETDLRVLYEDDWICIIDKPAGMAAHPGGSELAGTVSQAAELRYGASLPRSSGEDRPGIVHRLDKETSGVMVLALTEDALVNLQNQFKSRLVTKEYHAIVVGEPRFDSDWIDRPLGRSPKRPDRIQVLRDGKNAETYWEKMELFDGFGLLRCLPKTGRTHQIRVHLCSVSMPIIGDKVYQARDRQGQGLPADAPMPERHCLHAFALEFDHPGTGEHMRFEAPLPEDLSLVLDWLREHRQKAGGGPRGR